MMILQPWASLAIISWQTTLKSPTFLKTWINHKLSRTRMIFKVRDRLWSSTSSSCIRRVSICFWGNKKSPKQKKIHQLSNPLHTSKTQIWMSKHSSAVSPTTTTFSQCLINSRQSSMLNCTQEAFTTNSSPQPSPDVKITTLGTLRLIKTTVKLFLWTVWTMSECIWLVS